MLLQNPSVHSNDLFQLPFSAKSVIGGDNGWMRGLVTKDMLLQHRTPTTNHNFAYKIRRNRP
jgi:hypothetical protein